MNELRIRTKAIFFVDYKSIDLAEHLPKFHLDQDKFEKDLQRIQYANGKKEDVDTIAKGDLVLLSCRSEIPRFQRDDIYLIVGKNLYSAELEDTLVGCGRGETALTVDAVPVTVHVKSIVRTTLPALTDENVRGWGIAGVSTVEGLERYCFNRQVDAFRDDDEEADMVVTILCGEVTDDGAFQYDEAECRAIERTVDAQIQRAKAYREELIAAGEELDETWDVEKIADTMAKQTLKAAALGYQLLEEKNCLTTLDRYQEELKNRAELMHLSLEEMAERYTETDYALEYYAQYFFDLLDGYVGEYMKDYYYRSDWRPEVYDVAIIGAGPAGLSAALTLQLHHKKIVWFGADTLSDKVERSEKIANYAGFEPIGGRELNERFRGQMAAAGLALTDKKVTQISPGRDGYRVLADNDIYRAKTILLAIGAVPARGIGNELELLGHGVSYCATCDGFLYQGKTIAVFCGDRRYEHEVEYLAEIAGKVYLSTPYRDSGIRLPNVEMLEKPMKAVLGEKKAEGVLLADHTKLPVDGVFFLRSSVAPATVLKGLQMDGAHIVVNRNCETNKPGCFAAGDCTGRPYQIAKAVGEGNVAAHRIVEYLSEKA